MHVTERVSSRSKPRGVRSTAWLGLGCGYPPAPTSQAWHDAFSQRQRWMPVDSHDRRKRCVTHSDSDEKCDAKTIVASLEDRVETPYLADGRSRRNPALRVCPARTVEVRASGGGRNGLGIGTEDARWSLDGLQSGSGLAKDAQRAFQSFFKTDVTDRHGSCRSQSAAQETVRQSTISSGKTAMSRTILAMESSNPATVFGIRVGHL